MRASSTIRFGGKRRRNYKLQTAVNMCCICLYNFLSVCVQVFIDIIFIEQGRCICTQRWNMSRCRRMYWISLHALHAIFACSILFFTNPGTVCHVSFRKILCHLSVILYAPIEVGCKSRKIGEQKTNLHPTSLESLPWIPACWAFSLGSRNFGGIRKSCEQALARQDC